MTLLIKNARVIDPAAEFDSAADILIKDGVIAALDKRICAKGVHIEVIDAAGLWAVPGLIDMHVHMREPGFEYKEDIFSASLAAAVGGFTSVVAMPNTNPVIDTPELVRFVKQKAAEAGLCRVYPAAAVTVGQEGKTVVDVASLIEAGAVCISEDGKSVANSGVMRDALVLCKKYDIPMLSHCESPDYPAGVMNEGKRAAALGLSGQNAAAEYEYIKRDIALAEQTGASLHICHISTAQGVAAVRAAKKQGLRVTCEATPHHFILTEDDITGDNADFKMNPPLRSRADTLAVLGGLQDGTIDCIATDHAPHAVHEKTEFATAAFGIIGLETALPLCLTHLYHTGILTAIELIRKLTEDPAKILQIPAGTLTPGSIADITLIDPDIKHTIDPSTFRSEARNTPFGGRQVMGRAVLRVFGAVSTKL